MHELSNLIQLCNNIYGEDNFVNSIVWKKTNSPKSQASNLGNQHEFVLVYAKNIENINFNKNIGVIGEDYKKAFRHNDNDGRGPYQTVALIAGGAQRSENRSQFEFKGVTEQWLYKKEQLEKWWDENKIYETNNGNYRLKKYLKNVEGKLISDIWIDNEIKPLQGGTSEYLGFDTQKPRSLIKRIIKLIDKKDITILDFFAGSGTTIDATISQNKEDGGNRKYLAVEMGNHFESIMIPRIKKKLSNSLFKYQKLEQYEDTLENIKFESNNLRLINDYDDYIIKYMLDYETKSSVLNIDKFDDPFNYKITITENKEKIDKKVNLMETFNYLIGLKVKTFDVYNQFNRKYKVISGKKDDESVLVIWRKTIDLDLRADKEFIENELNIDDYKKVYINGDNYVENSLLIEESFRKLMLND
ncbi:site-specific DNA-methyltransferase [Halanaerobium sp. Z-7514]|uniref:Methyltransferase n=1 Tax=Halanaerobium polyolivorans TaxID=2886943 RepID=A0AAW4X1X4_9FIRM|nr:site-specific DNA-methyltransferase [Halanaerobium polyolivorans]